jgi:hypothetical protein
MAFNAAQYEATINKITSGLGVAETRLGQLEPAAIAAINSHPNIPAAIANFVMGAIRKLIAVGRKLLSTIKECLKGAIAPVFMAQDAFGWVDVRGMASTVQGRLKPASLTAELHWKGNAADAYGRQKMPQGDAAGKIAALCESLAFALGAIAAAGLAFYALVAIVVVKWLISLAGVIAAMGTLVLAPGGIAYAIGETTVDMGLVIGAITTLVGALGLEVQQMLTLKAQLGDNTFFPGGRWPDPVASSFSDATVTDGDADWSFKR